MPFTNASNLEFRIGSIEITSSPAKVRLGYTLRSGDGEVACLEGRSNPQKSFETQLFTAVEH
jgi:hypothetical protein